MKKEKIEKQTSKETPEIETDKIKNIKIKYEEKKEKVKKYEITYEIKNKKYSILRRYNDFKSFRKALRKKNPFLYIQPIHPKISIVR